MQQPKYAAYDIINIWTSTDINKRYSYTYSCCYQSLHFFTRLWLLWCRRVIMGVCSEFRSRPSPRLIHAQSSGEKHISASLVFSSSSSRCNWKLFYLPPHSYQPVSSALTPSLCPGGSPLTLLSVWLVTIDVCVYIFFSNSRSFKFLVICIIIPIQSPFSLFICKSFYLISSSCTWWEMICHVLFNFRHTWNRLGMLLNDSVDLILFIMNNISITTKLSSSFFIILVNNCLVIIINSSSSAIISIITKLLLSWLLLLLFLLVLILSMLLTSPPYYWLQVYLTSISFVHVNFISDC